MMAMDALQAIMSRRSVRSYTGSPISRQQLRQIVSAGMQAPSAHGSSTWRFLTITDRAAMRGIIPYSPWWGLLDKAGALIVVCTDPKGYTNISHEFQVDGCAAAMENMLLAAHALELGGVWLGVCPGESNYNQVKSYFHIPDGVELVGMLAVGEPGKLPEQTERFDAEKWFEESWRNTAHTV